MCTSQENLAPNVLANVHLGGKSAPQKRMVRRAKKVARPAAATFQAGAGAVAEAAEDAEVAAVGRPASPQSRQRQKLGDGSAALLQRCAGVTAGGSWQVSPPLSKVQERHSAFSTRIEATFARGPSMLALDAQQQETRKREVDGLAQSVAECVALEG